MKKILKYILLLCFALVITNQIWGNLIFHQYIPTVLKVAVILAIFEVFLKPIVKILLLPLNILTLGLIRIFINTFGLYLAVFFIGDFSVGSISRYGFDFSGIIAFIITSFTVSSLLHIFKSL